MAIFTSLVLLAAGVGLLMVGADGLVRGASAIARRLGVSSLVVGLTVVAFGTSMPELTVNLYAAYTGATDIAVGNIVGSNIANILLILGIAAFIVPLSVKSSTVRWEIPLMLVAAFLVYVFGQDVALDGGVFDAITRSDGVALLAFFVVFMFYIFALVKVDPPPESDEAPAYTTSTAIGLSALGLAGLIIGGKLLVDNAMLLARLAGLSETLIGLTVVAVGTSLPELATSVVAAWRGEVDIAVGNVVGSNIFNIFWILGLTAVITPLPTPDGFARDAFVMVAATAALLAALFIGRRHQLERWQGGVFLAGYVAYLVLLVTQA